MKKDITSLSFEEALAELENIAMLLEDSSTPLDHAIGFHEHAEKLRKHCEKKLSAAKLKIEKIVTKNNEVEDIIEIDELDS